MLISVGRQSFRVQCGPDARGRTCCREWVQCLPGPESSLAVLLMQRCAALLFAFAVLLPAVFWERWQGAVCFSCLH